MSFKLLKSTLAVITFVGAIGCINQKQDCNFKINGTIADEINDSAYFVFIGDSLMNMPQTKIPVDTIVATNKKFSYSYNINEPRWIYLQAIFKSGEVCGAYVDFLAVPNQTANLKVCNGYYELDGTPFYKQWNTLDTMIRSSRNKIQLMSEALKNKIGVTNEDVTEYRKNVQDITQSIRDYILTHKNEEGTMFLGSMVGLATAHETFDDIDPQIRNGRFKIHIDRLLQAEDEARRRETEKREAVEKTSAGKMFSDFSVEYQGKEYKLSDYVGKGKYVLVDFWASWCGPCRGEIPNLIAVYNKYKGKNFNVLGVASWDKPEDTQKAIDDMKIPYPQIINAQKSGTDVYGIQGIPEIILFGPDGTILKRGLRGNDIEIELKKYLK